MTSNTPGAGSPPGRATTFDEFLEKLGSMNTPAGVEKGLTMTLQPTDIVVAPFGKSGTTWLQQIAHTLRTRGDMDFDDISRVVPWIETSTDLGLDLDAQQKAEPRVFKSHLDAHRIPAGGRYIIACRDPRDAAYSMFKFMEGWFLEPGAISLDDFVRQIFIASGQAPGSTNGDYWTHLKSWWVRRDDPDVLFMAYEHMKEDLPGTIRAVAEFMEIALDDELMAIAAEHASLQFMQEHKDRFDDKLMRERSVAVAGIPSNSESSKVRVGQVGESRQRLGAEVSLALDELWRARITEELGFVDYASMIATLRTA
ncbi:MAG: sulfotransferase domain-containing protein [Halioglobus sp.]|nr:sulfotransferase domain-containing protein [Halioglobus sp.]